MTLNRFGSTTDRDAVRRATLEALAAEAGDFNVDALVDAQVDYSRKHDGAEMDPEDFWALVETHAR